ncbi:MAG: birA [Gammaproteobacteria bacterium]|jgi:BirA family biotin operon repressor/biotin-[acetyl-CoA-carboxylase] ligase|nr:birA [Gammaproteobacteria bacterium]
MQTISDNLIKLTELLNDGEYHDGTSIGDALQMTRAGVWKLIKKLEQYDIPLTSVKGKGYRLDLPLILLDPQKILRLLAKKAVSVEVLEKVDSTNQYLKCYLQGNKDIRVCIAETQSQGRGRLNRQWHSPFGQNVYLSLLYPFQKDISELSGLSLVVSLALCHTIEIVIGQKEKMGIKWPNDMVVSGQKIAGILIEIQAESHGFCQTIIGIGVNVNTQQASDKEITQAWSSLQKLSGYYIDRNAICAELILQLLLYLERFSSRGLATFLEEWQQRDVLYQQPVTVISGNQEYSGIGHGIDAQGHLLLKMADGSVQSFSSGDTTLKKLYR